MNTSIVFIVITYYADDKVLRRLLSVLDGWSVIQIDNSRKNLGYGGGANVGMRKALEGGAQWVVVMNQDLEVTKQAANELTGKLKNSKPGIVGPIAGGLDRNRWTSVIPSSKNDYISGSCIAIHRDVITTVGEFYEPYFLYYEEIDLCIRAKRAGYPLRWLPISGISHEETISLGRGTRLHQFYLARNHLLFVERQAPIGVKSYEFLRLPKTILEHTIKREYGALIGLRDYFFRRFGMYRGGS